MVTRNFTIYDHNTQSWTNVVKTLNSSFLNTYTSGGYYAVEIQKVSGTWYVYLWNYDDDEWEELISGSGDSYLNLPNGWNVYEEYLEECSDTIPNIEVKDMLIYDGSWHSITYTYYGGELYSVPYCLATRYDENWTSQYYQWDITPQ